MQDALPILLTIEIVEYEKKGSTVYYYIEIMANSKKKWNIERRFKDIEEMHKKLAKKLNEIPFLPAKSIFQISGQDLEKRKDELEKYFNILASRRDVLNDSDFKSFLEIDKHVKIDSLTKIRALTEIQNLPRGVKDFLYLSQKGFLFVLVAETNTLTRLGTMISNLSNPKGKEEMSSIIVYQEDPPGSLEFTKLWKKSFEIEATIIALDFISPYIAIGFTNGSVTCLSLKEGFTKHQEFCKVFCHNQVITGMAVAPDSGHLITCSTDKFIIKTDVAANEGKLAEKQHVYALTSLCLDNSNKRFFVTDAIGSLFIYSTNDKMEQLGVVHFPNENYVKTLFFDPLRNLLISGSMKGIIAIYDIGKPGKEKYSAITGSFETIKNVKTIHFNADRKEIYVASTEGNVAFVNTLTTTAFHVFEAHSENLSKMVYLPNKLLMITAAGDKSIKFWRYPFDPKEKLTQKIIDQSGQVLASTDPAQQFKVQKNQEKKEKGARDDDDDDGENSPRAPLTLLRYQPAVEVNSDDDEADTKSQQKNQTSSLKEPPKPIQGRAEEKKSREREDSPKNFLFKNSLDQGSKKKVKSPDEDEEEYQETKQSKKEQVEEKYEDPLEKRLNAIKQREEAKKLDPLGTSSNVPTKKVEQKEAPVEIPSKVVVKETERIGKIEDEDKPLDIEELKKKNTYVPLTFQKKADESDDEDLAGWNS